MKYQIFLHRQQDGSYQAKVSELPQLTAQGKTDEEALRNAKAAVMKHLLSNSIEFAPPLYDNTHLLKFAGRFKDDPTWDAHIAEIERYRREVDEAEAAKEHLEEAA